MRRCFECIEITLFLLYLGLEVFVALELLRSHLVGDITLCLELLVLLALWRRQSGKFAHSRLVAGQLIQSVQVFMLLRSKWIPTLLLIIEAVTVVDLLGCDVRQAVEFLLQRE